MDYTLILYTDTLACACAQHTLLHEHITAHSVATLVRAFAREEARDFDDGCWLYLMHEGKMRLEYCRDNDGSLCYLRAIQGHSGGIPIGPEMMNFTLVAYNWKEHIYHRGNSWNFQSILVSGIIPGGKENDKARQAVLCKILNLFGNDQEEKNLIWITLFLKRYIIKHIGNAIKKRYIIQNCQERRIKDCESGKQNH